MKELMKTLGFSIVLILAFNAVTYVLPQMEGAAPEETEVDVGSLNIESFVAMGKELYQGKGTCSLCHNELGRAPDLFAFDVGKVSLDRLADDRYQGDAIDSESYLRESMIQPSRYVVAGFGTKGSNDTESPMPAIDKPPAQLSDLAIDAIIAFLQHKDGNPVTVALPSETAQQDNEVAVPSNPTTVPAFAQSAEEAMLKFGCAACHAIGDSQATLGPDLRDIAARQSIEQIRESIANPSAIVGDGFLVLMPAFPHMTIGELELLVQFLAIREGKQS